MLTCHCRFLQLLLKLSGWKFCGQSYWPCQPVLVSSKPLQARRESRGNRLKVQTVLLRYQTVGADWVHRSRAKRKGQHKLSHFLQRLSAPVRSEQAWHLKTFRVGYTENPFATLHVSSFCRPYEVMYCNSYRIRYQVCICVVPLRGVTVQRSLCL